jgi:hypothetical protein
MGHVLLMVLDTLQFSDDDEEAEKQRGREEGGQRREVKERGHLRYSPSLLRLSVHIIPLIFSSSRARSSA